VGVVVQGTWIQSWKLHGRQFLQFSALPFPLPLTWPNPYFIQHPVSSAQWHKCSYQYNCYFPAVPNESGSFFGKDTAIRQTLPGRVLFYYSNQILFPVNNLQIAAGLAKFCGTIRVGQIFYRQFLTMPDFLF